MVVIYLAMQLKNMIWIVVTPKGAGLHELINNNKNKKSKKKEEVSQHISITILRYFKLNKHLFYFQFNCFFQFLNF